MKYNHVFLAVFAFFASVSLFTSVNGYTGRGSLKEIGRRGIPLLGGAGKGGKGGKGGESPSLPTVPGGSVSSTLGKGESGAVIGGVSNTQRADNIEAWGLTRTDRLEYRSVVDNPQFMNSFTMKTGQTTDWRKYEVYDQDKKLISSYLISPEDGAYVNKYIHTGNTPEVPNTMMSARDMMADNIVKSHGDLASLRFIGTDDIVEKSTGPAVEAAFKKIGKDFKADKNTVVFTPGGPGWAEFSNNPIVQGQMKFMDDRAAALGNARIESFTVITVVLRFDPDNTVISMVAKLVR